MKYKLLKNVVPNHYCEYLQEYTLELKKRTSEVLGKQKSNGSGIYWRGLDMASSCDLSSDEENQKLYDIYTSKFMYDIITPYIPNPYLFNDQVVVKEPNENFVFESHYDNQHGPTPGDKSLVTINCMIVLDDFTDENGAIVVMDTDWIRLYPKVGDILMIEGFTSHRSFKNNSDDIRRAYLCVYSNKPIGKGFKSGFYYNNFLDERNKS